MAESLKSLRAKIAKEVPYVDIKPYSHNIIGIVLGQIGSEFGKKEVIKAMKDFDLVSLGWTLPEKK